MLHIFLCPKLHIFIFPPTHLNLVLPVLSLFSHYQYPQSMFSSFFSSIFCHVEAIQTPFCESCWYPYHWRSLYVTKSKIEFLISIFVYCFYFLVSPTWNVVLFLLENPFLLFCFFQNRYVELNFE